MTEPTDDEIAALRSEFGITSNGRGIKEYTQVRDFARAVLAKWGTPPAVAGEKVYLVATGLTNEAGTVGLYERHDRFVPLADCEVLYTIPQPTQAQAVNQADRPFIVRLAEDFAEECVTAGFVTTKAASYGRLMDEALSTQAQAGVVPPEAEPIVLNCEAPGDLKPGDYVFASRWSDCDPGDPWEVGFVSEVGVYPESMTKAGYVVLQGGSRRWGRAMRITPEQGRRICEQFPSMERLPQDYDAIARVFGIKGGQHGTNT